MISLSYVHTTKYRNKSPPAFHSTAIIGSLSLVLCFREPGRPLNGRGVASQASSHASSYFTGALFVSSISRIVLKGETVFANNTAYYEGGKTVKCTI